MPVQIHRHTGEIKITSIIYKNKINICIHLCTFSKTPTENKDHINHTHTQIKSMLLYSCTNSQTPTENKDRINHPNK